MVSADDRLSRLASTSSSTVRVSFPQRSAAGRRWAPSASMCRCTGVTDAPRTTEGVPAGLLERSGEGTPAVALQPDAGERPLGEGSEPVGPVHRVGGDQAGGDGNDVAGREGVDCGVEVLLQQPDTQDLAPQT